MSELIVLALIFFAVSGYVASASSSLTLHLAIQPIPSPKITSVLGDTAHHSIVVLGTSETKDALIDLYTISDPSVTVTRTNADGSFAVVFDASSMSPGNKVFTATAVVRGTYVTDPGNKVAVTVKDDYSVDPVRPSDNGVHIGNTDNVTAELIGTLNAGAVANKVDIPTTSIPQSNAKKQMTIRVQLIIFIVLFVQFFYLLLLRAHRKQKEGASFFKLGRGLYPAPH